MLALWYNSRCQHYGIAGNAITTSIMAYRVLPALWQYGNAINTGFMAYQEMP